MSRITRTCVLSLIFSGIFLGMHACTPAYAQTPTVAVHVISDGFEPDVEMDSLAPRVAQITPDAESSVDAGRANPLDPLAPRISRTEPNDILQPASISLFGGLESRDLLDPKRRGILLSPGADVVLGVEAFARKTTDSGSLLQKSPSTNGVHSQQRTPIVTDTRIRGGRTGQVLASGSAWIPARMDLDTMLNKLDSQLIQDMVVIKGPYAGRYGPGFGFVDIQLVQSPRYADGPEMHGSTTAGYQANGEQWAGRQSIWGGTATSGYYVSYGHRTGVDYRTGAGDRIPSSYHSRDLFAAIGHDLTEASRIEFNYLRLDQSDVEFPGLVFDINTLETNGYELRYFSEEGVLADHFFGEVWFNETRFDGDTFKPGKEIQIPTLKEILFSPDGVSGDAITNVSSSSLGTRGAWTWECDRGDLTVGGDYTRFRQALNDVEIFLPLNDNNFPIPESHFHDIGLFAEWTTPFTQRTSVTAGGRLDYVQTSAVDDVPGVPLPVSDILAADLKQEFGLWALYGYGDHVLNENYTLSAGVGYAQRPPTLTELYALSSFIGTLQRGLTFVLGDPNLDPERRTQLDLTLRSEHEYFRGGVQGYAAWVEDFITYDLLTPADPGGGLSAGVAFVNTDLAFLTGAEAYGEFQLTGQLDAFGNLSYIEGRDLARTGRSGVAGREHEPLPGIPPLTSLVGLRLHEPYDNSRWAIELACRIVDNQDRVAASLEEVATPGFTVWDFRSYFRVADPLTVTFGVENFTDKYYQEHLDYRTGGIGVYRPGIGFYLGSELVY